MQKRQQVKGIRPMGATYDSARVLVDCNPNRLCCHKPYEAFAGCILTDVFIEAVGIVMSNYGNLVAAHSEQRP